jgi:hypothetical protein
MTTSRPPDNGRRATSEFGFPSEAIVGSIGELAMKLASGTEVPEEFLFACGLTILGAVCSGELMIKVGLEVDPRLYTVLLGGSYDVKKSTAMRRTIEFFESLGSTRMPRVMYGIGSAEGLARFFAGSNKVLLAFDELRAFVDKTKVQTSVLLPMTASLYEQHAWENATKHSESDVSVRNARLSILGCCTTDTYEQMWTSEAVAIGFPNRLFVVGADRKPKVAWPPTPNPSDLASLRAELLRQLGKLPLTLEITGEARGEWDKLYQSLPSSEHVKRLDTLGFRLLALIAFTTNKTAIDTETVRIVRLILDYELRIRELTDPIDAENTIAKMEEKIRRRLARTLLKSRELKKAVNAHRVGLWAFDRALLNLRSAGEVKFNPDGTFELIV